MSGSPKTGEGACLGFTDPGRRSLRADMKPFGILLACAILLLLPRLTLAGPPFRTDDPEPVEIRQWEINLFSAGTRTRDAISAALPGIDANYGAAPELQLHG